jgi:hypothetical protein
VSLGDVKTLASAPGLSTQQQVPLEDRLKTGIKTTTIRMSVGMENVADICADIQQALVHAVPVTPSDNASEQSVIAGVSDITINTSGGTLSQASGGGSIASSISEKTARLKAVYDQLSELSAEAEALQASIKTDSEKLRAASTL